MIQITKHINVVLLRVFDPEVGDRRMRYLDMPVVNVIHYEKTDHLSNTVGVGKVALVKKLLNI